MEQHQVCLQEQGWNHPQLLAVETSIFEQLGYQFSSETYAQRHHILLVDDQPETVQLLSAILRKQGHYTTILRSPLEAVDKVRELGPDLIVLDVMMPFMDGYTVCQQIKEDPQISNIPIVFISALQNPIDKIKAFRVGGADYLVKPLQYEEVVTRIEHQLHITRLQNHLIQKNQRFQQEVQEHHQNQHLVELVTRAFDRQQDYILVVAQDGQILYASPSTSDHLGYSPTELLKLKFYHLHAPLLPQQMFLIRQTLHQESILTLRRVHHISKQGHWLPIYLKLFSFQLDHHFYGCLVAHCLPDQ
ncbi:MAG: response regulator [Prochlorothrix sp.]